ncbi:hypothetical protein ACA910_022523 [Epithemia clementina (nom. ined.)]
MDQTPLRANKSSSDGKTPAPQTPGWSMALFGWGRSTAKKNDKPARTSTSPSRSMPPLVSRLEMGRSSEATTTATNQGRFSQQGQEQEQRKLPPPAYAQQRPLPSAAAAAAAAAPSVTFASSVPPDSPWRAQSSSAKARRTPSHSKAVVAVKSRAMRPKYRPSSATLNKHIAPANRMSDQTKDAIRRALIRPSELIPPPSQHLHSLSKSVVLRKGRTLHQSHDRLLEDRRKLLESRKRVFETSSSEGGRMMGSPDTEDIKKRKHVQFQVTSGVMSPQSTGSSQGSSLGSSITSLATEPPPLRPLMSLDDRYQCILETETEEDGADPLAADLSASKLAPSLIPFKPTPRVYHGDMIARLSAEVKKEEVDGSKNVRIEKPVLSVQEDSSSPWKCQTCNQENKDDETLCTRCQNPRSSNSVVHGWDPDFLKANTAGWKCAVCSIRNLEEATQCASCEASRDGVPPANGGESTSQNKATMTGGSINVNEFVANKKTELKESKSAIIGSNGFIFGSSSIGGSNSSSNDNSSATKTAGAPSSSVKSTGHSGVKPGDANSAATAAPKSSPHLSSSAPTSTRTTASISTNGFAFGGSAGDSKSNYSFGGSLTGSQGSQQAPFASKTSATDTVHASKSTTVPTFNFGGATAVIAQTNQPAANEVKNATTSQSASFSFGSTPSFNTQNNQPKDSAITSTTATTGISPPGPSSGFAWPTTQAGKTGDTAPKLPGAAASLSSADTTKQKNGDRSGAVAAPSFGISDTKVEEKKNEDGRESSSTFPSVPFFGAPPTTSVPDTSSQALETENDSGGLKKRRSGPESGNGENSAPSSNPTPVFQFGATSGADASSHAPAPFTFGKQPDQSSSNASSDQAKPASTAAPFGGPTFGAPTAQNSTTASSFNSQAPFSFGSSNTSGLEKPVAPPFVQPSFGGAPSLPSASSAPTFGQAPFPGSFGGSSATGNSFGANSSASFGGPPTAPNPSFGAPPSAPASGFQGNFGFGSSGNTTGSSGFGGGQASATTVAGGWAPFPSSNNPPNATGFGSSAPDTSFGSATPGATFGSSAPTMFGSIPSASGGMGAGTSTTMQGFGSATPYAPGGMGPTSSTTQGFGNEVAGNPGFGAPDMGFSLGSGGNTTGRRRKIKARRPVANK